MVIPASLKWLGRHDAGTQWLDRLPLVLDELTKRWDGDNAMGQIAGAFAMRQAIECAREMGIAAAAVRGSNHAGAMDYYVRLAVEEDMIGLATTNALPTMAPWGGVDKLIGLNPIGIGVPSGEGALVLDTALGATAHGKIRVFHQKGQPIPGDWAFDREGRPTTDAGAALDGLIQPIGGYKRLGLAVCTRVIEHFESPLRPILVREPWWAHTKEDLPVRD